VLVVTLLGYLLIGLAAAIISAPIAALPRIGHHPLKRTADSSNRRKLTLEFVANVADQLRVGNSPQQALSQAAALHSKLGIRVVASDGIDQNIDTLRRNAIGGAEALLKVALFLELSNRRGTSLISALDAIAESIENELSLEDELLSEIAGARATGTLMSLLPILILMALHPFHFLFGTMVGRIAFGGAVILNLLGRFWLHRIINSALAVTS
jgi:tight adherence protein B